MKRTSAALALFMAAGLFTPSDGLAQSYPLIDVKMNHAKVMRVSRPAAMIIVGNPAIADATIKDSQTLIITGKQHGTTNLIVLDSEGEPIADELLQVTGATEGNVVVYKGNQRHTLTCAPYCDPVYQIGDEPKGLMELDQQIRAAHDMIKRQKPQRDNE